MNTTVNSSIKSINIVLISSYTYDDSLIDDNRAWYTVYKCYRPDTDSSFTINESTGFGENFLESHPEYNIIKKTPELEEAYAACIYREEVEHAKHLFKKYCEEIEEYNKSFRPQSKGQLVEIMTGRRKGKICKISWIGRGKTFGFNVDNWYRKAYPMAAAFIDCINSRPYRIPAQDSNLIRVWPVDGSDPFYISIDKAKVVEGFEPMELKFEDVFKFDKNFNSTFIQKWRNGYNYREY